MAATPHAPIHTAGAIPTKSCAPIATLQQRYHHVYKRNLNPVYEPTAATFDFPIYLSQVNILGTLDFAVWDKDLLKDDFLGKYSLPVHQWFRGTAFAFNDPNNQPFSVRLASSHPAKPVCGTICFKVGLVHPPNSTSLPDFGRTYNTLISHGGIVLLEICCAKDLPKWPNMTHMGWDMDPFVEVSIGEEIKRTKVIQHSRNPVWDEQLLFHVRGADLSHSIQLTVIDWDKITPHDPVGKAEINITAIILEKAKEVDTGLYSVNFPTMVRFECYLTNISGRAWTSNPTLTFRRTSLYGNRWNTEHDTEYAPSASKQATINQCVRMGQATICNGPEEAEDTSWDTTVSSF
ncbi:C2 domain-containing protein [Lactarius hengduanensis]|nr:C2 domain-containing protein [Lactarius hengduanensis]